MNYKVYISYAAKDSMLAEDLRRRLQEAGVDFVSITDTEGAESEYVRRMIRSSIKSASEVIALLTDNSVKSKWVLYEVGIADSLDKPVTFVVVNEGVEKQLPIVGNKFVRYSNLPEYITSLKKRAKAA